MAKNSKNVGNAIGVCNDTIDRASSVDTLYNQIHNIVYTPKVIWEHIERITQLVNQIGINVERGGLTYCEQAAPHVNIATVPSLPYFGRVGEVAGEWLLSNVEQLVTNAERLMEGRNAGSPVFFTQTAFSLTMAALAAATLNWQATDPHSDGCSVQEELQSVAEFRSRMEDFEQMQSTYAYRTLEGAQFTYLIQASINLIDHHAVLLSGRIANDYFSEAYASLPSCDSAGDHPSMTFLGHVTDFQNALPNLIVRLELLSEITTILCGEFEGNTIENSDEGEEEAADEAKPAPRAKKPALKNVGPVAEALKMEAMKAAEPAGAGPSKKQSRSKK